MQGMTGGARPTLLELMGPISHIRRPRVEHFMGRSKSLTDRMQHGKLAKRLPLQWTWN